MVVRPSGTVTFLFSDIEGSTRRWEAEPESMGPALVVHDDVLRSAIEGHGGRVFKHTGDGVCAAFSSVQAAVRAAVEAQRRLRLPVRMGIATGEAHQRDGDYFGPVLNRTARVMAAGHGGQILVAESAAVDGVELLDLGEHHLRDLSSSTRLFQVRAEGLAAEFPPLRTADRMAGNLPMQETSLVGRGDDVAELIDLVHGHRLVTLTGVGGVGKTRLALQVATELAPQFPDGVWLVELAPVGNPAAVPDVVAAVLNVTPQAGLELSDSIARALSGRRLLMVLDNCEHLVGAAADLVETILAGAATVRVLATSREGLSVRAEQLWPVPPLDVDAGVASPAVELFVERAKAQLPRFEIVDDTEAEAVTEVCRRLDGIALAIELAAARMVSMSARDLRDRLSDRFRLLCGPQRGSDHHHTLRHAVKWSYDLLDDDERSVLGACSVFSDGFDLAAATQLCGRADLDEYAVLDLLESLVRKSLVTVERARGHARYGMLETIRQFAQEEWASTTALSDVRTRHARYFADLAIAHWDRWNAGGYRDSVDWVDLEFANLRAAYRWAMDQADLDSAAAIAAHATMLAFPLQRLEPVGWSEQVLEAATGADLPQLPRLYSAASLCTYLGRPLQGVAFAQAGRALEADPRFDPFEPGWSGFFEAIAHRFTGRVDRYVEISAGLTALPALAHVIGLCSTLFVLPALGRTEEAVAIADETVTAARGTGNPFMIAWALNGYGRAFTEIDPLRALDALRQGLRYSREQRVPFWEANMARDAAGLEAIHGDHEQALAMFETTIDSFHRTGNTAHAAATLANLAALFDRLGDTRVAATVYGTTTPHASINMVINLPGLVDDLRAVLGQAVFDECVASGAAMEIGEAVQYARHQIQLARHRWRGGAPAHPLS